MDESTTTTTATSTSTSSIIGVAAIEDAAAAVDQLPQVISFKKKGKRKEFRAPAQSLAATTDTSLSRATREGNTSPVVAVVSVTVEDDTHNEMATTSTAAAAAAAASSSSSAAAAASSSSSSSSSRTNDHHEDNDSDEDDDNRADRPSIAFSAAAAAAAAAQIEEEDPVDDHDDNDESNCGIHRPSKRVKKDNPLVQSTRNKLKKEGGGLTIQSTRTVVSRLTQEKGRT